MPLRPTVAQAFTFTIANETDKPGTIIKHDIHDAFRAWHTHTHITACTTRIGLTDPCQVYTPSPALCATRLDFASYY